MEKMGNLASSSSKPHFFQPIHPDCSSADHLAIPKAFQVDYLVDREDSEGVATLKSPLKSWKVKLNDFKFTDGWPEFYKAHELIEYSVTPLMSEGEDENEMHFGETGTEGMEMDRAESIGTSKGNGESEGKSKCEGQGRKEQTSSDDSEGNLNTDFVCVNRCNN
ncbi:hypothetical protein MKX03_027329 [Papaver bracteatum]|nr:hypothetical protein MKX03_027329 [Papaver bracteatum]